MSEIDLSVKCFFKLVKHQMSFVSVKLTYECDMLVESVAFYETRREDLKEYVCVNVVDLFDNNDFLYDVFIAANKTYTHAGGKHL